MDDILKKIQEEFKKGDRIDSNSFQSRYKRREGSDEEIFIDICKDLIKFLPRGFPRIDKNSNKKSLIVETRNLPHNEFVIKNTIQKLGDGWGHIIYCHLNNYDQIKSICNSISSEIEIRVLEKDLTRNSYNSLLLDIEFWNDIDCKKVLVYQTDTFIFKEFDDSFLDWDYIGAPWGPSEHSKLISKSFNLGYELNSGNGGFSLRTVEAMLDALRNKTPNKNGTDTDLIYEDVFFSSFIFESDKWKIPNPEISNLFCSENIFNTDSFACHQPWDKPGEIFKKFLKRINGVNVYGFGEIECGICHNMRMVIKSLEKSKILCNSNPIDPRNKKSDFYPKGNNYFETNIFVYNPDMDQYNSVIHEMEGKYNIGIWAWELEVFPDKWIKSLDLFDEIWVISDFIKENLKKYSGDKKIEVIRIPGDFGEKKDKLKCKKELGFDNKFIVLFCFDAFSDMSRKNPEAVISAFKKSLSEFSECLLIIKSHNLTENQIMALGELPQNIILINETWDKDKMNALFNSSDIYCSLHRSEGLGFTMMEAISLGIPVVCTNWSANLDFCLEGFCELVDFEMIEIPKNSIYNILLEGKSGRWADPSIEIASEKLLKVYENYDYYRDRILENKKYAEEKYNLLELSEFVNNKVNKYPELCFVNKSYIKDLYFSKNLYLSFEKFFQGNNKFYICVPETDLGHFKIEFQELKNQKIINKIPEFITDESVIFSVKEKIEDFYKLSGHCQQQVIKLGLSYFFEKDYVTLDSDIEFIKNFNSLDFYEDGILKTIFHISYHMEKSLFSPIYDFFEIMEDDPDLNNYYIDSYGIWNHKIVKELFNFMKIKGIQNFIDLIKISPLEKQWYGTFVYKKYNEMFKPILPFVGEINCFKGEYTNYKNNIEIEIEYKKMLERDSLKSICMNYHTLHRINKTIKDYIRKL